MKVFHNDGTVLADFEAAYLVRCPRCGERAHVLRGGPESTARFVCGACGLAKEQGPRNADLLGRRICSRGPTDRIFHLPLWLQRPCCGRTLWAYNLSHATFLEAVVSARLRLRSRPIDSPDVNRRLLSRLPKWLLAAKHRDAVLHGVAELRRRACC